MLPPPLREPGRVLLLDDASRERRIADAPPLGPRVQRIEVIFVKAQGDLLAARRADRHVEVVKRAGTIVRVAGMQAEDLRLESPA